MRRDPGTFWSLLAMSLVAFAGFAITYFGPMARGAYPHASATVHLHGWSFFAWYLLAPVQSALVHGRHMRLHRLLGVASVGLATVMVTTGIVVATVILHRAAASPFWSLMGVPILSLVVLFAVFYGKAIAARRRPQEHKRWMMLASAAGLGAATFRIAVWVASPATAVSVAGFFMPWLFILAAVGREAARGKVHAVNRVGGLAGVGVPALLFLIMVSPAGDEVVGWFGDVGAWLAPVA